MNFLDYHKSLVKEAESRRVGVFPGAFKPPHKGHYQACATASRENDEVHVIISPLAREMITADISKAIWNVFARTLPNVIVAVSPQNPVKDTYDLVEKLNNSPDAANYAVNLYADEEDLPRFSNMKKFSNKLSSIQIKPTARVLSARDVRLAIADQNWQLVASYMPENVEVSEVINILKTSKLS